MKGFGDLFRKAVLTFRKAFLSILGIYFGFALFFVICGAIAALAFGKDMITMLSLASTNPELVSAIPLKLVFAFGGFVFLMMLLTYLMGFWGIIVFRNNALISQSLVKEAFFEACRKFWKVIVLSILLMFAFGAISILFAILLKKFALLILLPLTIFLMPMLYTMFFALICQEGSFKELVVEGFLLGYRNWLRVFGTSFFYMIIFFAMVFVLGMGQIFITKVVGWVLLGSIVGFIVNFVFNTFTSCFFSVFYLDLAEIEPTEEITVEQIEQA